MTAQPCPAQFPSLQTRVAELEAENQRLRQSEYRYRQMFENAPISMVLCDRNGYFTQMNAAAEAFYGLSIHEFNQRVAPVFDNPQLIENNTVSYMQRALAGEAVIEPPSYYDSSKDFASGKFVNGRGHYAPIRDASGAVEELIEICPNYHEFFALQTQLMEEQERAAQDRARLLATVARVANLLLRSPDYTTVLPEVMRILGETAASDRTSLVQNVPDPHTGKAAVQLHTQWCQADVSPSTEGIPELKSALLWEYFPDFEVRLNQGETLFMQTTDVAEPARSFIQALGNRSIMMVPIIVNDQFWGVFSFDYCREVKQLDAADQAIFAIAADSIAAAIERQVQEDALQVSEKRFRELFEASNDCIYFVDFDPPIPTDLPTEAQVDLAYSGSRFTDVNPATARLLQLNRLDIIGQPLTIWHSPDSLGHRLLLCQLIENGWQLTNTESEDTSANGQKRYWLSSLFTTIENGHVTRGRGVVNNITPLKEAQQALLAAEQARTQELAQLNAELQQTLDRLSESEKRYRTLFELNNEGIYRFEFDQPISTLLPPEEQVRLAYQHWRLAEANSTYADHYGVGSPDDLIGMGMPAYDVDSEKSKATNRAIVENGYQLQNGEAEETINGQQRRFLHNVVCDVRDGYVWGGWGSQIDITELRQTQDALAEERQQAETALIRERTRIAQEIHDTLAQTFTGITVQLKLAQYLVKQTQTNAAYKDCDLTQVEDTLNRIGNLARTGLSEARRSVWAVYPATATEDSLPQELANHIRQATNGTALQTQVVVAGTPQPLSYLVSRNLLRVCQEAITNALKHASATTLEIHLTYQAHRVSLHIADDGCGFEPQVKTDGFGLVSMSERMDQINGQLRIITQPGEGTEIFVEVSL
ncbi:MAG: PAS domain S-box protein [Leptolyngbyaceae cyanobacterium]